MEKVIVMFVDYGDTCDGKARWGATTDTEAEAKAWIRNDMEAWADKYAGENITVNFDAMAACFNDGSGRGCEWSFQRGKVA